MKISVIVPAFNEEEYIENCIKHLLEQEEKADEIIVVDNNSTDKTVELASQFPVRIVKEEIQGMIPARNRGFNEAEFEIIARTDADSRPPKDWIKKIKDNFQNRQIDALSGYAETYDVPPFISRLYVDTFYFLMKHSLPHSPLVGPNMALTKSIWNKIKNDVCMDDKSVHEDVDLSIHIAEAGGKIHIDKNVMIYTSARRAKSNPTSFFFEYPYRLFKTIKIHKT